jgi:hypothetical protein
MKINFKRLLLSSVFSILVPLMAHAQVDITTSVMSRYNWRGTDFGNSPSIQPTFSYTKGAFSIGAWGAYATNGNAAGTEIDLYATYAVGDFTLMVTDYTFPDAGAGAFLDADGQFVEVGVSYASESFPLTAFVGAFVLNDDENSVYAELGYSLGDVGLFLGMTPQGTPMYGTSKAGIVNTGFSYSKPLVISESLTVSLSSKFIVNPYAKNGFLLFGFSL